MLHAHGLQKSVGYPLGQGEGTVTSGGEPTYSHVLVDVETVANQNRQAAGPAFSPPTTGHSLCSFNYEFLP